MDNLDLLRKFFKALNKKDADTMFECYHENISFTDPIFGKLNADDTKKMWRMLFYMGKGNLHISFKDLEVNDLQGTGKWKAVYRFGRNRRRVINKVESTFIFQDNKIIEQRDVFNVWGWSKQALGWKGWLLGWSSLFKSSLQKQTLSKLKKFILPIEGSMKNTLV